MKNLTEVEAISTSVNTGNWKGRIFHSFQEWNSTMKINSLWFYGSNIHQEQDQPLQSGNILYLIINVLYNPDGKLRNFFETVIQYDIHTS